METLDKSPNIKNKIIALISVADVPVSRDLLKKLLLDWGGIDSTDPALDAQIDEALTDPNIQKKNVDGQMIYEIAPDKQTIVAQYIGTLQAEADRALATAGLKLFGIE